MKIISFEEVKKLLGKDNPLQGGYDDFKVTLYEGNTKLKGDINLDSDDKESNCVVVLGNLDLQGSVVNFEGDYGNFLVVTGSLKTKNIIAGGSEIYILGDAAVKNAIYAFYNHGTLSIGGKTKAKVIMSSDHDSRFEGGTEGVKIALYSDEDFEEADFYPDQVREIIDNKFLDPEGNYVKGTSLIKTILAGKKFLKTGAKTHQQKTTKSLESIAAQMNLTEQDLSNKRLRAFPTLLTRLTDLKKLNLSENNIRELPSAIGRMSKLEELYLSSTGLTALPKEIGQLQNLQVLDISYDVLKTLPEEFAQLKNLKILKARACFEVFPEVIAKLEHLEELTLTGSSWIRLKEFPIALTNMKNLKKLDISGHAFTTIPEEILNLENLEELNLDDSLGYLKSIPDLSRLKKLKTLHFNGRMSNTKDPDPSPELLKKVFLISQLENLSIDRWHKETKTVEGKEVVTRPPLETLPEAVGNMANLKTLDLAFNNITHFPESFYNLKNLQKVNLDYNQELPFEEFKKLITRLPSAKFIVTNIPLHQDVNDEHWQKVHSAVKFANADMIAGRYQKAAEEYEAIISLCQPDTKWSEYDHLYANYGKMYCLSHMVPGIKNPAERARVAAGEEAAAQACLELVKEQESPMYFSDESAFHREIKRYAYNALAWRLMERTEKSDTANL